MWKEGSCPLGMGHSEPSMGPAVRAALSHVSISLHSMMLERMHTAHSTMQEHISSHGCKGLWGVWDS